MLSGTRSLQLLPTGGARRSARRTRPAGRRRAPRAPPPSVPRRDTVIYSAVCPKLGNRRVAVKVYDRQKVQPTKYRAIKREIAMMMFFSAKRCGQGRAGRVAAGAGCRERWPGHLAGSQLAGRDGAERRARAHTALPPAPARGAHKPCPRPPCPL